MKYKLKKWYPSLPVDWEVGDVVKKSTHYYTRGDGVNFKILGQKEVENSPEFWEKIEEKDYEIISFTTPAGYMLWVGKTIQGWYTGVKQVGSNDYRDEDWLLKHGFKISTIKRLSDGEVFTIGDTVIHINDVPNKNGVIENFYSLPNVIWFKTDKYNVPLRYIQSKVKQPIFTTEDGVDMYEGDKFYPVCVEEGMGFATWVFIPQRWGTLPYHYAEAFKYFSTKEAAKEYIFLNKPCLSLKDVNLIINKKWVSTLLEEFVKQKYEIQ